MRMALRSRQRGSNDYKQRSVTRTTSITIGYAELNTELKNSNCIFDPAANTAGTIKNYY
jgi:hypothetical protein